MNEEKINEFFSYLVGSSALEHNGEIAIPSIVDMLPLLEIEKTINVEDFVKTQYEAISNSMREFKISGIVATKGVSFIIPLTAYIPLPTPYYASLISRDINTNETSGFTCVTINDYNPRIKLGEKDILLQLSYAIVTVADKDFNVINGELKKYDKIHKIYCKALAALNSVINAYKTTPYRHSHILQTQAALSAPGCVFTVLTNFPQATIIEEDTINLHNHFIGELYQARIMSKSELESFRKIHVTDSNGQSFPLWLVSKLNEAIDARCNGKDDSAIVLADHYVELSIRFLLYKVLLAKGLALAAARKKIGKYERIENLIEDLAIELCQPISEFKSNIQYSIWYQSCRKKRNVLNHDIKRCNFTPAESFKAVDSSATIIKKICEIINSQYQNAIVDTQWLINAVWMTELMKTSQKSKKIRLKNNEADT